ncbi:hypothetical protein ABW19_dt0205097 [Dactylella cylindrospora]|nr:hypothetical protein ABW19_dt0205097 [Dactylella cylindrospora]
MQFGIMREGAYILKVVSPEICFSSVEICTVEFILLACMRYLLFSLSRPTYSARLSSRVPRTILSLPLYSCIISRSKKTGESIPLRSTVIFTMSSFVYLHVTRCSFIGVLLVLPRDSANGESLICHLTYARPLTRGTLFKSCIWSFRLNRGRRALGTMGLSISLYNETKTHLYTYLGSHGKLPNACMVVGNTLVSLFLIF